MRPAVAVAECLKASSDEPCDVVGHGYRKRKAGPEFPIATRHCREHSCYFSVYPFGHVPYGRMAMAPIEVSGFASVEAEREDRGGVGWQGTVCVAAIEAARNRRWSREGTDVEAAQPGRYGTQRRWLRRCARFLGLAGEIRQRTVERLRDFLGIDGLEHQRLRREWPMTSRLSERAQAVVAVLDLGAASTNDLDSLLDEHGLATRLWGTPPGDVAVEIRKFTTHPKRLDAVLSDVSAALTAKGIVIMRIQGQRDLLNL